MGAQDQIGFQKAAPLQPFLVACTHPWLLFRPFFLYTLPLAHFPHSSSLLRALINTLSTFSSSLKIPPSLFHAFHLFLFLCFYHLTYLSCFLPPSLPLPLATSLFSPTHSVIPNYLLSLRRCSALSPFMHLSRLSVTCSSIPPSLIHLVIQSFMSSRVSAVLQGVFVVLVKVVLLL